METLIHFNENGFNETKSHYESIVAIIQSVVNGYNKMKLPNLRNSDELYDLFIRTADMIYDKMTGGKEVQIAGFKVNKQKAMEILLKPDGYDNLIDEVKQARQAIGEKEREGYQFKITVNGIFKYAELDNKGNVVLKDTFITLIKEKNEFRAKTEKAKKLFEFAKLVREKYIELGLNNNEHQIHKLVEKCFFPYSDSAADPYIINWEHITKFNY